MTRSCPNAGIFQFEQAKALSKAGHTVGLISVGLITLRYFLREYIYEAHEIIDGVSIWRAYQRTFLIQRWVNVLNRTDRRSAIFRELYERYEAVCGKPDIVHAHNILYSGFLSEWLWNEKRIPFILTEHSSSFMRESPARNGERLMPVLRKAHRLTCVSSALSRRLYQLYGLPFDVLHNLVDESFFKGEIKGLQNRDEFIFLSIGTLDKNKNHSMLIRAFASEFKGSSIRLRIAGEGYAARELRRLVTKLGVESQVSILGGLTRSEVSSEMLKANCFVLPSNVETFGVVLIEALASGLPLIATRSGGPQDIVNDGNGTLIDVGSEEQLQEAMRLMIFRFGNYDREQIRADAENRFGANIFTRRLTLLYRSIVLGNSHSYSRRLQR